MAEDTDAAVTAAHAAFETFRKVSPRTRAQCLLKWDSLIRENRDDLASIVTYETGKPLSESQGELDYALGFTWWFAGEAERVRDRGARVRVEAVEGLTLRVRPFEESSEVVATSEEGVRT